MENPQIIQAPELERETGLSNDLLRKWRSRYGFPLALKQEDGRQGYSREQINQLCLIKRLLDAGFRPALIVGKPLVDLERLLTAVADGQKTVSWSPTSCDALAFLRANDIDGLTQYLVRDLTLHGLTGFVRKTVAPLATDLGKAWVNGLIEVYQEHLCTDVLLRILYAELSFAKPQPGCPRILFATPSDELHMLGMLMAQAVLADHGAHCISVGSQTPVGEIEKAARAWQADIVAISFSFAYPTRRIRPLLAHLRSQLPEQIEIWAGGAGVAQIKRAPAGVRIFTDLYQPVLALQERLASQAASPVGN